MPAARTALRHADHGGAGLRGPGAAEQAAAPRARGRRAAVGGHLVGLGRAAARAADVVGVDVLDVLDALVEGRGGGQRREGFATSAKEREEGRSGVAFGF